MPLTTAVSILFGLLSGGIVLVLVVPRVLGRISATSAAATLIVCALAGAALGMVLTRPRRRGSTHPSPP